MGAVFGRRTNVVVILIAGALFFTALGFFLATGIDRPDLSSAQDLWTEGSGDKDGGDSGPNFAPVAKKLRESIVSIRVDGQASSSPNSDEPQQQPPGSEDEVPELPPDHPAVPAEGSGFIISEEGYIITNHHVIEGGGSITVDHSDGNRYTARVIGSDPRDDIALLKVDPEGDLPVAPLGDSDNMELGDWVMAMGNPLGFEYSATVGVVSGKGRALPSSNFRDFIQTDAAIYPGNSGGPLVNLAGEVIGINTAVIPDTNLGFAVPINTVKEILPQLLQEGKVTRGYLGVTIGDISELPEAPEGVTEGAAVAEVHPNSPAEKAGIQAGDVIVAVDGQAVAGATELTRVVTTMSPGSKPQVTVIRDGKRQDVEVTLEALPPALE